MRKNKTTSLGKAYDCKNIADSLVDEQKYAPAIKKYEKASEHFATAADIYEKIPQDDRTPIMEKHIKDFNNLAVQTMERARELESITGGPGLIKRILQGPKVRLIIPISSIILGLVLLAPNLTGNTIATLTTQTTNIIAGALIIIGIIACCFWFKK